MGWRCFAGCMRMPHQLSVDEICQLVSAMLLAGYPTIDKTAGIVNVSTRTLQRQLSKAGVTYAELVAGCRFKEAKRLLRESEEDIQNISTRLGYEDPSSFSRAFQRWAGITPRRYRCQLIHSHVNSGYLDLVQ